MNNKKLIGDYAQEPSRSDGIVVTSEKPFNGETPSNVLVRDFITPADVFYVRNRGAVPQLDASTYRFQINDNLQMSLRELQHLAAPVTVTATLLCAGNRRKELNDIAPVEGICWEVGAIGNASWTGVRLRDLLLLVNAEIDNPDLRVEFIGEETAEDNTKYRASIPMGKAADPNGDVLLAWEMNGEPLERDHGFPLRVVVPGFISKYSVKWLKQITIIPQKPESVSEMRENKILLPNVNCNTSEASSFSELAIQSAICEPVKNQIIPNNSSFQISGYALSNGNRVTRVEVSLNNGKTWQSAEIVREDNQADDHRCWSWSLWRLQVDNFSSPCTVVCRAWDISGNTQPEHAKSLWNPKGVMNNSWHRIVVKDS